MSLLQRADGENTYGVEKNYPFSSVPIEWLEVMLCLDETKQSGRKVWIWHNFLAKLKQPDQGKAMRLVEKIMKQKKDYVKIKKYKITKNKIT